jgi:hypothetical protein
MTDQLTGIGSEQSGNPDGGNGAAPNGSGANAAATGNEGPGAQQPGNLDWAKAKGWLTTEGARDASKIGEGYQALEKKLGSIKAVPDEKATPEQWDEFHKGLGWPGDPSKYEFARPADLPKDMPYDEGMAKNFKDWANAARLTPKQAQALHDGYVKQFAGDFAVVEKATQDRAKAAHEALVKDWGDPKSETYKQNTDAATRALRTVKAFDGLEKELKDANLLTKEGYFTSPALANMLAAVGRMAQNDTLIGNGGNGGAGANPFAKETRNMTEQATLIRSDPVKARALAKAAGWTDTDIGW